ncbi:MAG TPA: TetR/AcrR family transcriptional regulator [Herpetosiphonaceae bacterium]|nr:TetR/AcrR family transcriptional regulator [Herpetosiphonaceae bacterium]
MPTQTFLNLPPEKRATLVSIALDEFAAHDYQSASISRILAQAGIAKGSLYQYFSDKRDFYHHVVAVASDTLTTALQDDLPPDGPQTLFQVLRWQMRATVRAALRHPRESQLLRRAYGASGPQDPVLTSQAQLSRTSYLTPLIQQAIARGEIAADLDSELVLYVISSLIADLGTLISAKLGLNQEQAISGDLDLFASPVVDQIYDTLIRILDHGLAAAPAPQE